MLRFLNARARRLAADEAGITLVEIAVVIGLLTVVMVPVFMFMTSLQKTEARVSNATVQDQDARLAFERLTRSMRESNYPQGRTYTDAALFHTIGTYDVRYYSNANNDVEIERTRYYISGRSLLRTVSLPLIGGDAPTEYGTPSAPNTIIKNVVNLVPGACGRAAGVTEPLFTYYSKTTGGGAPTAVNPTTDANAIVDINQVKITVQVQADSVNAPACQTLTSVVHLRNWRG